MSILETLEGLVDELRGTRPPTKQGVNGHTLHAAIQYNSSLVTHFENVEEADKEMLEAGSDEDALTEARKEMERLRGDIARLKAQLQEM